MAWAVYTYLIITLISLGFVIAKNGETYKVNALATIISQIILYFLLYKGGFFNSILN